MTKKTIYYTDELTNEFSTAKITPIKIDKNYNYAGEGLFFHIIRFFYYRLFAFPLAILFLQLKYRHKIVGRKCIKDYIKHNKGPIFLFANHTNPIADALIPSFVAFPKGVFVIVSANNVSIPLLRQSTKYLGALPLPDDMDGTKNFIKALNLRLKWNSAVCIYPEAHIWPYYTKIRPFLDTSFRYPVQHKAAVFCFCNTYQKRKHSKNPRIVTYVDGPFFPDETLEPKARRLDLRNKVYNTLTKRSQNSNIEIIHYQKLDTL